MPLGIRKMNPQRRVQCTRRVVLTDLTRAQSTEERPRGATSIWNRKLGFHRPTTDVAEGTHGSRRGPSPGPPVDYTDSGDDRAVPLIRHKRPGAGARQ